MHHSVREVEIVVSVVIVFTLAEAGSDEVECEGSPCDSEPYSKTKVDGPSLDEEALESAVHEVEEPLLGGVGSVMPDITSCVGTLLIEVLLSIPEGVCCLGHSQAFTVGEAHIFGVTLLVMLKTATYN